jgi:hypothetical protein
MKINRKDTVEVRNVPIGKTFLMGDVLYIVGCFYLTEPDRKFAVELANGHSWPIGKNDCTEVALITCEVTVQ